MGAERYLLDATGGASTFLFFVGGFAVGSVSSDPFANLHLNFP